MELLSVFTTQPLFTVFYGRTELGQVDPLSFQRRQEGPAVILLGGRAWTIEHVEWKRHFAWVKPSDDGGKSRWSSSGPALSYELCQAIAGIFSGVRPDAVLSNRAQERLAELHAEMPWAEPGKTFLVGGEDDHRIRWWTFAGDRANLALAQHLGTSAVAARTDPLSIALATTDTVAGARTAIEALRQRADVIEPYPAVSPRAHGSQVQRSTAHATSDQYPVGPPLRSDRVRWRASNAAALDLELIASAGVEGSGIPLNMSDTAVRSQIHWPSFPPVPVNLT